MAKLTGIDILDAFKDSVKTHYDQNMTNTEALKAEVVQASTFVKDRFTSIRETFNNNQTANNMAHNGGLFKGIFKALETGASKAAEDDGGEVFTSSGSQSDNSESVETTAPKYSADTMSRNKTSYDVAGIQVKALVSQTTAIVTSLSDQTSYLKNMDSNLKKIYDSLQAGFKSQEAQNVEAAKQNKFYSEQGYLNIAEYMKHVKEQSATTMQMLSSITNMFKDPKQFMTSMFGLASDKLGVDKMFKGIDDAIAKGFTRAVDKVTDSNLLKGDNIISKTLKRILTPGANGETDGILNSGKGIDKAAKAQFDNITHRTINDVIPGLLERNLAQSEIIAQILSQSTGIQAKASGTTYDMSTGKFSTSQLMRDAIRKNALAARNGVDMPIGGGEIDLSRFKNVLQNIIHYMATNSININQFYNMDKTQLWVFMLSGCGLSKLDQDAPLAREFEDFYAVFRPRHPGSNKRTPDQDKAIKEITRYYNNMCAAVTEDIQKLNAAVSEGRLRSDVLNPFDNYSHTEIARGKAIVGVTGGPKNPRNGAKLGGADSSESMSEVVQDMGQEIITAFKTPFESFKRLADKATTPGSIYVHDTVAIQYLKALKMSLAPGKRFNGNDIAKAWDTHKKSQAGVSGDVGSAAEPEHRDKPHKPNADTSYATEDLDGGVAGTTGIAKVDDIIGRVKYQGMQFAHDAGYKGFDKNLNSDANKSYRDKNKGPGFYEKSMDSLDRTRIMSDIDTAVEEGKISRERGDELRKILNTSSPDEYKTSLMKSLAQWSPVILGGLLGGPFGALAGLGIRNYIKKNTSQRVSDQLKKGIKTNKREQKAQSKYAKDRLAVEDSLQQALEDGKITYEEYEEGMREISTSSADEYKGGLMKWAKKLGPAVLGGIVGGPLGFLAGAMVGNHLAKTTAGKMKNRLKKIKPSSDVWDDDKRDELLAKIDDKIKEMEDECEDLATKKRNGNKEAAKEYEDLSNRLLELKEHRKSIASAGKAKLLWYFTSLPGILSLLGKIRKLPGMAIRGIGKGIKLAATAVKTGAQLLFNKAKLGLQNLFTRMFIGNPALATSEGRAMMYQSILDEFQKEDSTMTPAEFNAANAALDKECAEFDKKRARAGMIGKVFKGIGKGIGAVASGVKFVAGIPTGSTHKAYAAKANLAAAEAQKMLRGEQSSSEQIQAVIADHAARTADATSEFVRLAGGNSINTADAETHSLLRTIINIWDPTANTSAADRIDKKHANESPNTLTSKQAQGPSSKSVVNEPKGFSNGQRDKDATDEATAHSAMSTLAEVREDDADYLGEVADTIAETTDDNSLKGKIKRMFDEKKRSLKQSKKKEGGDGDKKEDKAESLIDKLLGGLGGFGSMLAGLFGGGGISGVAAAAGKFLKKAAGPTALVAGLYHGIKSFSKPINEDVESRAEVVDRDWRNAGNAALYGGNTIANIASNPQAYSSIGTAIKNGRAAISSGLSNVGGRIADSRFGQFIGSKAKNVVNAVKTSSVGTAISSKAKDLMMQVNKFIEFLKNNTFIKSLGQMFSKSAGKSKGGKCKEFVGRLFKGGGKMLKTIGKRIAGAGLILEIIAGMIEYLERQDTNFSKEMENAITGNDGDIVMQIISGFQCVYDNFVEASKKGGETIFEGLLQAAASAGVNYALSAAFPIYALIKLGLTLLSFILDFFTDGERDATSITYNILKTFKFLIDDLLALDESVIDSVASALVDIAGMILALFTLDFAKFITKLHDLFKSIIGLISGILKSAVMVLVDLIIIALLVAPGVSLATLAFIKLGGGTGLLECRKIIGQCINGEITFGDMCSQILSTMGEKLKNALNSVGEFFTDVGSAIADGAKSAWDSTKETASKAGSWISDKWNSVFGKGRGRRSGRGGLGGDLYQEDPMYRQSSFNMFEAGCGPIALAAALRNQGINASPTGAAAALGPYRGADGGTDPRGILDVGNRMGGNFSQGSTSSSAIANAARQGKSVVMMGQNGPFGDGMHYMTTQGMQGNNVIVRDPLNPELRQIPKSQLSGVTSAIYGQGRGGIGGAGGRGIAEAIDIIKDTTSKVARLFGGLLGDPFGAKDNQNASDGPPGGYDPNYEGEDPSGNPSTNAHVEGLNPIPATGDCVSNDGQLVYPQEMCKDPTGQFPNREPAGSIPYKDMLPTVKELLIAQYKYTLVLPSVVGAIMRGETSFGMKAGEKNLGNIKKCGADRGTKVSSNKIYDSAEGSNAEYEAYNYYGQSIYRIGQLLSTESLYPGVKGHLDTLSCLRLIGPIYATAANWGDKMYEYWKTSDMNTLKQYDQEAIVAAKQANSSPSHSPTSSKQHQAKIVGQGRGGPMRRTTGIGGAIGGRGFAEAVDVVKDTMSKIKGLFGGFLGEDDELGDNSQEGDGSGQAFSSSDSQIDAASNSGGTVSGAQGATPIREGSMAGRVLAYLRQNKPDAHTSLEWRNTTKAGYTANDPHTGIDFSGGGIEGTPIYSPTDGEVVKAVSGVSGFNTSVPLGNHILMKDSAGRYHRFAHMQPGSVTSDKIIKAGSYLGKVGNTGRSYGAHLHYQINKDTNYYKTDLDPGSVTGLGRAPMFAPKSQGAPPPPGIGGMPEGMDYTNLLKMMYDTLLQIAQNTGASLKMFSQASPSNQSRNGFGRGPSQPTYNHPKSMPDRLHHKTQGIGAGYQVMARGY